METYAAAGDFLLLKERSRDALGTLWRAGELGGNGFKRIVWLRRFDPPGLDRAALEAATPAVKRLAPVLTAPNIARNATLTTADGVPCLAYDYVPGPPLDELFSRAAGEGLPIAPGNALLVVDKIAAALCAALTHEVDGAPLLHGFLVPPLVLVGNDGEAVVAGFGLGPALLANLDREGVAGLAAPYLAPEVRQTRSPSRRGDVFSLGAILYHLLCGAAPPAAAGGREAALAAPQLALDEGPVPEDLAAVLRRALAERPGDRYPSALDVKKDLEKLLYGGAYSPTTFSLALFMDHLYRQDIEEEDRELQREKALDVTPYLRPAKPAAETAPAAPRSSRTVLYGALAAIVVLAAAIGYLLYGRAAPQPATDVAGLIQSEVARQLAEKEAQIKAELDRSRQETEKLRKQLADEQKRGNEAATSETQRRQREDLQKRIAAREEEQRRNEEQLAQLQQKQREQAATPAPPGGPAPATAQAAAGVPAVGKTVSETNAAPTAPPEPALGWTGTAPAAGPAAAPPAAAAPAATPVPSPLPPTPEPVRVTGPVDASRLDAPPKLVSGGSPAYPTLARRARVEGVVTLRCTLDREGRVAEVSVVRGLPMGLTEAAVEAVKKWRYAPSSLRGVPVEVLLTVDVTFRLK